MTALEGRAVARGRRQWPLPKQADPDAPLLVVEGLTTHFRLGRQTVHAVDDVSFTLNDGEALGIAGESGCGKTTTALSLLRLLPSNAEVVAGSVRLFGIDLLTKSDNALRRYRWREISIIFQGAMNALNPVRRVGDQIAEPMMERQGLAKGAAARRAGELLELVGVPRARGRAYPHELSGGMRQRAMIAMALVLKPDVLIADEPTTALDVTVQAQILDLIRRLKDEYNTAVVMITHDLGVIAEIADEVAVMYAGRVMERTSRKKLFTAPELPYTWGLMRSIPRLDAPRPGRLDSIAGLPPSLIHLPSGCPFHPRCPYVMDACLKTEPRLEQSEKGHLVACHLPEKERQRIGRDLQAGHTR